MNEILSNRPSSWELVDLLLQPRKTNAEWQAEAGRLTSLVYLQTLASETSDFEYLSALALCKWAQASGVVGAKNKSLQAVRFRTKEAPPLADLPRPELVTHALALLSDLRADWCKDYIAARISDSELDKNDLKVISKWAMKVSKSVAGLVEMLIAPSVVGEKNKKRNEACLKVADKLIDQVTWPSASAAAKDLSAAMLRIAGVIFDATDSPKVEKQLWSLAKHTYERACQEHPFVLLEPEFATGVGSLAAKLSDPRGLKNFKTNFSSLIDRTLSCLAVLGERGGGDGQDFCRALIPTLVATYPDFGARLADASAKSGVLAALHAPASASGNPNLEDAAASVYARLLPSWHEFYSTYADADKLSVMNANLLEAAAVNSIEFMGATGEVVDFDPVAHRLQDGGAISEKKVRLVRPSIVFRRSNGSYRIVLPAIVSST